MDTRPLAAALSILTAMVIIGFIDSFVAVIAREAGVWQFHLTRRSWCVPLFALIVWRGSGASGRGTGAGCGRSLAMTVSMVLLLCGAGRPAHRAGGGGVLHGADLRPAPVGAVHGEPHRTLADRGGGGRASRACS
jgi:hypothetical protein